MTKMLKEANAEVKDSESLRTMQALDSISRGQAGLVQAVLSRSTSSGGNQAGLGRHRPQGQGNKRIKIDKGGGKGEGGKGKGVFGNINWVDGAATYGAGAAGKSTPPPGMFPWRKPDLYMDSSKWWYRSTNRVCVLQKAGTSVL